MTKEAFEKIKSSLLEALEIVKKREFNRCSYCGRFISIKEIENDEARCEYTPDSDRSRETIEWWHVRCAKADAESWGA